MNKGNVTIEQKQQLLCLKHLSAGFSIWIHVVFERGVSEMSKHCLAQIVGLDSGNELKYFF